MWGHGEQQDRDRGQDQWWGQPHEPPESHRGSAGPVCIKSHSICVHPKDRTLDSLRTSQETLGTVEAFTGLSTSVVICTDTSHTPEALSDANAEGSLGSRGREEKGR